MDSELLIQEVRNNVNDRLHAQDLSTPPDFLYRWIVSSILENYTVVNKSSSVDAYQAARVAEILQQWLFDNKDEPIVVDSNDTAQILQQLTQEGWIIIPPQ